MTIVPPRPRMSSRHYIAGALIGGKYELIRPLGEGGMGSVWLAKNLALDSQVALKLLRAELDSEDAGERLLLEARAAARLGHRAIVRVFDFGHTDHGEPYLVMELLDGQTLAEVLSLRGRLSPVKAVQMLLPVADALATAHASGIVHRDLKPENIFLARETRRTQPKIVDFGIAKVQSSSTPRALTQQGTVLGSPGYMSPEQARGLSSIDHRSDVWAFCVVLYECITARLAFDGDNYNAIMCSIIEDPVVPSVQLAAGDAALWGVIERGLRKDREERWPSMHELGAALARWLLSNAVEQDVCGEPLSGWLDETSVGKRDLLSAPPPSLAGIGPVMIPRAARALNETPRPSAPSFRPAPESTAAVVDSGRPARKPLQSSFLAVGAVLLVGITVSVVLVTRKTASPDAGASTPSAHAAAASVAPVEHRPEASARPIVAATRPPETVPPPATSATGVTPAALGTTSQPAPPRGKHAGTAAAKAPKPGQQAPSATNGLKDPY